MDWVKGGRGDGSRMIQACYIYCALYFLSNAVGDLTGSTGLKPGGGDPWPLTCVSLYMAGNQSRFVELTIKLSSYRPDSY